MNSAEKPVALLPEQQRVDSGGELTPQRSWHQSRGHMWTHRVKELLLALVAAGATIACWGQTEQETVVRRARPVANHGRISAGISHACAIDKNGELSCWTRKKLDRCSLSLCYEGTLGPNHCMMDCGQASPPKGAFKAVSVGAVHTCAIRADESLVCWGFPDEQLLTAPAGEFAAVSASHAYSCALRTDGSAVCWGHGESGEIQAPAGEFIDISSGVTHTCAVRHDRRLVCWGSNNKGQSTPPNGTFLGVSVEGTYSCGLDTDGKVHCWGKRVLADESSRLTESYRQIDTDGQSICGVSPSNVIVCSGIVAGLGEYGRNFPGSLKGTPLLGEFSAVSVGGWIVCGETLDGEVRCASSGL